MARQAGQGASRQDADWLRPVRQETPPSILLVKSDLKTRLETLACAPPPVLPCPPVPKAKAALYPQTTFFQKILK